MVDLTSIVPSITKINLFSGLHQASISHTFLPRIFVICGVRGTQDPIVSFEKVGIKY